MAFEKLQPVERSSKYHPAVRYNAILIIGMLDKTYASAGTPAGSAEGSLRRAELIVNSAADGKPVPPFPGCRCTRRFAAPRRTFTTSWTEPRSTRSRPPRLKLAAKDEALSEVDPKVEEWIRIQAATVLTNLGSPGPKGEVQAVLARMIGGQTQPKMSLDARGQVAALLKQMKYEGTTVDGKVMTDALLQLALDVGDEEAKEAQSFEDIARCRAADFGGGYGRHATGQSPHANGRRDAGMEIRSRDLARAGGRSDERRLHAFGPMRRPTSSPSSMPWSPPSVRSLTAASSADTSTWKSPTKWSAMGGQIRARRQAGLQHLPQMPKRRALLTPRDWFRLQLRCGIALAAIPPAPRNRTAPPGRTRRRRASSGRTARP